MNPFASQSHGPSALLEEVCIMLVHIHTNSAQVVKDVAAMMIEGPRALHEA